MAKVIVITSGKGGVGKSTITANLGMQLASRNQRVCLIDMDLGLNNLDVVLCMEEEIKYTLQDYVEKKCRLRQTFVQNENYPLLYLISSGNSLNASDLSLENMKNIIAELREVFDYIIIDCPAGIDFGFNRAVITADEAIVVTTPHLSSIRDANKVVTILSSFNIPIRFIVNRCRGDLIKDKLMLDVYEISKLLNVEFAGVIPEEDVVNFSVSKRKINYKNEIDRAFLVLTDNIVDKTKKLFDCTYKYNGFLGNVKKLLRRKL